MNASPFSRRARFPCSDKFGPFAERDAMVDVVVVHVAVNAVSCSPDAAGDGCGIEAHTRPPTPAVKHESLLVESHKQVVATASPFHD